ncbi:MAG: HAD family hydrolase [Candidatus Doudnabacteria bacterium]|nr:HAD family hydrolase [Candidatus Doudnabacteria bacterium]
MIKLVAFDWNGTILADTIPVLHAENAVRKKFGFKKTNLKQFREQYDIPIRKYWLASGFDPRTFEKQADEIQRIFLESYEPLEKISRTRTGAREILKWLTEEKVKTCIFSNHPQGHILVQVQRLKLAHTLNQIFGRDKGSNSHMHKRSKEEKLVAYVNQLKLKPNTVMTVGDTIEEIEIGKKHGFNTVAITDGYQSVARLKAANPDFLIHNLIDLKKIIAKL